MRERERERERELLNVNVDYLSVLSHVVYVCVGWRDGNGDLYNQQCR